MIGMFDSGVGGLCILRHVRTRLPQHSVVYVADQACAPYGDRTLEWVRERSHAITRQLLDLGAEMVVVACNTASAAALKTLRTEFPDVRFVGMEPAVKPAVESTARSVVGVLATRATFQSELYASVLDRHSSTVGVVERVGSGLVELVEAGVLDGDEARQLVEHHLRPMIAAGVDSVVLGCTHYPFLGPLMRTVLGPDVQLIDPAPAVARQTQRIVAAAAVRPVGEPSMRYLTTGDASGFAAQVVRLLDVADPDVGTIQMAATRAR